jgi:hypothetical protein
MNISNLGRLIGAGLLALVLHALAPGVAAGDADQLETGAANGGDSAALSSRTAGGTLVDVQVTLSPAGGRRSTESRE